MSPRKKPVENHTLVNGLRLLEHMAARDGEFAVSALAKALALPKSHAHRLLRTLMDAGYVEQSADTKKYRSDYHLLALAGPFAERLPLRIHGGPVLRSLSGMARADAYLAVPHQGVPLIVMSDLHRGFKAAHSLGVGMRLSRHASAFGKLFLALKRWPVEAAELRRHTAFTITTARGLRDELVAIRSQGYAVNRQENSEDVWSFAAPVRDGTAVLVGAIGLAVAAPLVARNGEDGYIRLVVDAAVRLSAQPL